MVKDGSKLRDMHGGSGKPIDPLEIETEQLHSLQALVYDQWNGRAIPMEQLL